MRYLMLFLLAGCAAPGALSSTEPPALQARAAERVETKVTAMRDAVDHALALAERHGPDRVLVLLDVDSTLLRDPRAAPDLDPLEAADPARFRQVERTVMGLKSLEPTEPALAAQLDRITAAGLPTYILTARGADMRDITVRELAANGLTIVPRAECGPPLCVGRGSIGADAVLTAARAALGPEELARTGFTRGRAISVWDGIVMAAGLDKGVLARTLAASLGRDIRAIVLIDDAQKNIDDARRAFLTESRDTAVFHYRSPLPPPVGTRAAADRDWRAAEAAICTAFAARWCGAR